jgi:UDP-N-acetylglucosamine transferase subunit ALG13
LKATDFGKPIIIMPRRGDLAEHRSNHQMATARYFVNMANVSVASDEFELLKLLNRHREMSFRTADLNNSLDPLCDAITGDLRTHRRPGARLRLIRKLGF